jgi:hypothetical protein
VIGAGWPDCLAQTDESIEIINMVIKVRMKYLVNKKGTEVPFLEQVDINLVSG